MDSGAHRVRLSIILFFGAPFLWMVLAAFDGNAKAYIRWPQDPTLNNFKTIFQELDFGRAPGEQLYRRHRDDDPGDDHRVAGWHTRCRA